MGPLISPSSVPGPLLSPHLNLGLCFPSPLYWVSAISFWTWASALPSSVPWPLFSPPLHWASAISFCTWASAIHPSVHGPLFSLSYVLGLCYLLLNLGLCYPSICTWASAIPPFVPGPLLSPSVPGPLLSTPPIPGPLLSPHLYLGLWYPPICTWASAIPVIASPCCSCCTQSSVSPRYAAWGKSWQVNVKVIDIRTRASLCHTLFQPFSSTFWLYLCLFYTSTVFASL